MARLRLTKTGWIKICRLVTKRDKWCIVCGNPYGNHHHHVVFRSAMGSDTIDNLVLLCMNCHMTKAHGYQSHHWRNEFKRYLEQEEVKAFYKEHEREINEIYIRNKRG